MVGANRYDNYYRWFSELFNFINAFRKCISEYLGYEIVKLQEASLCFNKSKKRKVKYQRNIFDV